MVIGETGILGQVKSAFELATRRDSVGANFGKLFPLAFRVCLPALNNNLVNLLKTTTLAYAIAVPEMMYTCNQIWSDNVNVPEMMLVMFIFYIILVGILVVGMHKWEHKMRIPGYG